MWTYEIYNTSTKETLFIKHSWEDACETLAEWLEGSDWFDNLTKDATSDDEAFEIAERAINDGDMPEEWVIYEERVYEI